MQRRRLAGLGLALGIVTLFGCAEPLPAPPAVAVGVMPAAPPPPAAAPVALAPSPAPPPPAAGPRVSVVPPPPAPPPMVQHQAAAAHHMMHRHWVRRYWSRYRVAALECGTTEHPCSVQHIVLPIE